MSKVKKYIQRTSKVIVIGVGNILLRDEGVGVHIVQKLLRRGLPEDVVIIDGGTATLSALDLIPEQCGDSGHDLIIVDAVKGGGAPGTIYLFTPEDIDNRCQANNDVFSLHQMSLIDAISILKFEGRKPESVKVIGIEPGSIDTGLGLSEDLRKRLPRIVEFVEGEIYDTLHNRRIL